MSFKPLLLSVTALLASCATRQSTTAQLAGEWNVVQLGSTTIKPVKNSTPFLGFKPKEQLYYGFTGCNRLTGTFQPEQFAQGKADFSRIGMTRMLCHDDRYESAFLSALHSATSSELSADTLRLKDAAGQVLVVLKKQ